MNLDPYLTLRLAKFSRQNTQVTNRKKKTDKLDFMKIKNLSFKKRH